MYSIAVNGPGKCRACGKESQPQLIVKVAAEFIKRDQSLPWITLFPSKPGGFTISSIATTSGQTVIQIGDKSSWIYTCINCLNTYWPGKFAELCSMENVDRDVEDIEQAVRKYNERK